MTNLNVTNQTSSYHKAYVRTQFEPIETSEASLAAEAANGLDL